jgi:hypothetical protein
VGRRPIITSAMTPLTSNKGIPPTKLEDSQQCLLSPTAEPKIILTPDSLYILSSYRNLALTLPTLGSGLLQSAERLVYGLHDVGPAKSKKCCSSPQHQIGSGAHPDFCVLASDALLLRATGRVRHADHSPLSTAEV